MQICQLQMPTGKPGKGVRSTLVVELVRWARVVPYDVIKKQRNRRKNAWEVAGSSRMLGKLGGGRRRKQWAAL